MNEVVRLWEGAAEQGHALAQHNLGVMYEHGQGVEVNLKKAFEWCKKAADQGYDRAQYNLGAAHLGGHGVDQSDSQAMRWYAKAAAQGRKDAQAAINEIVARRRASLHASSSAAADSGGQ